MAPRVSIGVPVYNGENYLAEMFESLAAQTFTDYEVIVSDNASTDSTAAIVERWATNDARIKVYTAEVNKGAGWNFNRVVELSSGEYFKWQAHDDLLSPDFLAGCVDALDDDTDAVLAYTAVDMVNEERELIERYGIELDSANADPVVRFREQTLTWNLCYEVFGLIRRSALDATEGMGNFSHGDGVLLAHLALLGPFTSVPDAVFISRQHSEQSARQFNTEGSGTGHDYREYAVWFDPSLKGKLTFPNWAIIGAYHRTIKLTEIMTPRERLRLEWAMIRRMRIDARLLLADLSHGGRHTVASVRRRFRPGDDSASR